MLREQGPGQTKGLRNKRASNEAQRRRYLRRFPSSLEGHYYHDPLGAQGPCSGSHVGSHGPYLCLTANRAAVWLQDRMNVSSAHGVFQNWRVERPQASDPVPPLPSVPCVCTP